VRASPIPRCCYDSDTRPRAPRAVILLNADTVGAGWHCSGNTPPATFTDPKGKKTLCPALGLQRCMLLNGLALTEVVTGTLRYERLRDDGRQHGASDCSCRKGRLR